MTVASVKETDSNALTEIWLQRVESHWDKLEEAVTHLKNKTTDAAVCIITLGTGEVSQCVGNIRDLKKRQILAFYSGNIKSWENCKQTGESGINYWCT